MGLRAAWHALRNGEAKESAAGRVVSLRVAGRPAERMVDFEQFAKEGYQRNVVAYRCVSELASAVAHVPLLLFAGEDELDHDHEVLQRLRRPNPMQGYVQWCIEVISYYLIAGNTYAEAVGPTTGPPRELYALRPDRMKVIPGANGMPAGYRYTVGSSSVTFPVDPITGMADVRHMAAFNPLDDWYGMSPIQAAATGINQFNEAGVWNQNLLLRGASRGGVLEMQPTNGQYDILQESDYDDYMEKLEKNYGGSNNAGRWRLVDGGFSFKDASFSPQDMDWINGKHTSARDICSAFGFPAQLLGIPGDNTYSNYKEARQALYENRVMPLLGMLLSELNAWYLPRFSEGLELRPDEDQVLGLSPRRESLWDRVTNASHLTLAEKREATGYGRHEPTGDPQDDLYMPSTELPLGFESVGLQGGAAAMRSDGGAQSGVRDEPAAIASDPAAIASDRLLNGAQVAAIVQLVELVGIGTIPRQSAIEIMGVAFGIEKDAAARIIGYSRASGKALTGDDLSDAVWSGLRDAGYRATTSDAISESEFERTLAQSGVSAAMVAELKRLGYGRANGEWKDHA